MRVLPFNCVRLIALVSVTAVGLSGCSSTRAVKSANAYAKQLQLEDHSALLNYDAIYYDQQSRFKGIKALCYKWGKSPKELINQFTCLNSLSEGKGKRLLYVTTLTDAQWGKVTETYLYRDGSADGAVIYRTELINGSTNQTGVIKDDLTLRLKMVAGVEG